MNHLNEQQLHQHVTIVGWLHIVGNAIFLQMADAQMSHLWLIWGKQDEGRKRHD